MESSKTWKSRLDRNFSNMSDHILKYFPTVKDHCPIEKIAALHLYVYEKVDYELREDRDFKPPKDCWRTSGNCQEQTVLLASLFKSIVMVEARTKSLSHNQDREYGHRTLEVKFPYHPKKVTEILEDFYSRTQHFNGSTSKFVCSHNKKATHTWIIADPTMSNHMADTSSLEKKGYLNRNNRSWEWYKVKSTAVL